MVMSRRQRRRARVSKPRRVELPYLFQLVSPVVVGGGGGGVIIIRRGVLVLRHPKVVFLSLSLVSSIRYHQKVFFCVFVSLFFFLKKKSFQQEKSPFFFFKVFLSTLKP